jgi:peptide/nickel transport system permease protein
MKEFRAGMGPFLKELKFSLSRIGKSPLSVLGISILVFYAAIALLAPVLAPPGHPSQAGNPYIIPRESYVAEPQLPSSEHIFGTAEGQWDIYYGVIWGTRTAFLVGIAVVAGVLAISLTIGTLAGFYGGIIDELLMRFTDIIWAFPGLILAMALVIAFGPSLNSVMIAMTLVGWSGYARVVRAEIMRVKQEDYIEAARAAGCSDLRVMIKHILPNSIYPIVIMASLDIGAIVLGVAGLSFLGLGPPEGYADWGQMISFSRNWIMGKPGDPYRYWFTYWIPGLFIFIFVLGWNLLGDAFRDIMDPTLRRR